MPLPRRETITLFGSLAAVCLIGFFAFGGLGRLGFSPRLEDTEWEFVSFTDASTVTLDELGAYTNCQLYFGYGGVKGAAQVNCFDGQYAYVKANSYSYVDNDTVQIIPQEQGRIPFLFGGVYDLTFEGDELIMKSTATRYTLRWRKAPIPSTDSGITNTVVTSGLIGMWKNQADPYILQFKDNREFIGGG